MEYDLLIKNGFIVDGSGNPGFYGDVLVSDARIVKVASNIDVKAKKVIDADENLVCPGFIDPHVHEELTVLETQKFAEFLKQGVTTTVNCNCGHSITPYSTENVFNYMYNNGLLSGRARNELLAKVPVWNNFTEFKDNLSSKGMNINMGFLLGHGTIRWSVMGGSKDREPTTDEYKKMKELIAEGMEQGCLGMSTGLSYIPGKFAETAELIELSRTVAEYDGIYASHIRYHIGELEAVKEVIEISKSSGVRAQVSHLTPTVPEAFSEILNARNNGLEIAVDTIPRSSGHLKRKDRMIQFIMSAAPELFGKGIEGVNEAMKTSEGREIILSAIRFKDNLLVVKTGDKNLDGRYIKDIAEERNMDPDELLLEFLASDNDELTFWQGGLNREDFPGTPYDERILNNPLLMVGSDRIFGEPSDPEAWYELFRKGAFPIYFKLLSEGGIRLEEIVRRVTSLPAQQFRLSDRGLLTAGKYADISIIDIDNYRYPSDDEIDYSDPLTMAEGVQYVVVNGEVVLEGNEVGSSYPGIVLT